MKKFITTIFAAATLLVLVACGGGKKEFAVDGEFTAYEVTEHTTRGVKVPQITTVTVTVKDGKITKYYIDVLQGSFSTDEETQKNTVAWNTKTKKQLGADYNMKGVGPKYKFEGGEWSVVPDAKCEKEWFEQAALIEAKWLADGVDSVTTTADSNMDQRIDNVAGVTLKDGGYTKLAKEAVANAKAGKFVAYKVGVSQGGAAEVYSVVLTVEKGKTKSLVLDTLQSSVDATGLTWNTKTKKQLGADYGMKGVGPKYKFEGGEWVKVDGNCEKEWHEQAEIIQNYVIAHYDTKLKPVGGRGGSLDGTTLIDDFAGVTIKTEIYFELIHNVFALANLK